MITPTNITNYNRTEEELEEFLMFAILVAGKKSDIQAKKLDAFLKHCMHKNFGKPFQHVKYLYSLNHLMIQMKQFKLGQYKRVKHTFTEILKFKGRLKDVTIEELESIKGIGSKTARFFILHSRPNVEVAVLDTHILKWMSEKGYKVPKSTPAKKKYAQIEQLFLKEAMSHKMTPADLDLTIWKSYATKA